MHKLQELEAAVLSPHAAGAEAAANVAIVLLRLVIGEVYDICVTEYVEQRGDVATQRKDMNGGAPLVDTDTWQHAAAALVSGVLSFGAVSQ
jgi:hypothetical protein